MAWVITRLCRDCVDLSCVDACPVDCIYEYVRSPDESFPNQLYIDPNECINCGVCTPTCPWEAVLEDVEVPSIFSDDIDLNAAISDQKHLFEVPEVEKRPTPTADQTAANRERWGYHGD